MSARAAAVDWLYDVEVPVTDQSAEVRSAAFRQALLVALKRITGLNDVPTNPVVTSALEAPQRYYVEYRYREGDNPVHRRDARQGADVVGAVRRERHPETRRRSRLAVVELESADDACVDRRHATARTARCSA